MAPSFRLLDSLVGAADVSRVKRSLETLDEQHRQAGLRAKKGGSNSPIDEPGRLLLALAEANGYNLESSGDRESLITDLEDLLATAPTVTMSFAVDPSAVFMAKIVGWMRTSINPHVLVRIGLQPNIAAGCVLRTPGKIYDFSLRSKFTEQRPMLIKRLKTVKQPLADVAAPVVEAVR